MSKSIKIIIGAFVLVIGLFAGVSFYVSTQINPELIRKEAVKVIKEVFPNANVKLEKLDYSLGTNVSFNIENFSLNMKKDKSNLINVSKLKVKIPLLSILTSGGNIDIIIKSPNIRFKKYASDTNWDRAMGKKAGAKSLNKAAPKKAKEKSPKIEGGNSINDMPSFVKNSKINLKILDSSIDYSLGPKTRGNIIISKIVVKNININSSAAFEVASEFKMDMGADKVSSNILIVGDIDIKKFLESEEISSNIVIKLQDTKFSDMSLPSVQTKIKAEILKSGLIKGTLNVSVENLITIKAIAQLNGDNVKVDKIDLGIDFENSLKYLKDEMGITINEIDANKSELHLLGKLSLNLKTLKMNPQLKISTTRPIKLRVSGLEILSTLSGSIVGKSIDFNVKNELFKGVMTASVKTKIDPMNMPKDLGKFSPVNINIKATGFHIERAVMQKLLYSGKVDKLSAHASVQKSATDTPAVKEVPMTSLPPIFTNINFDQCYIGKDELKIKGKISFKNNIASTKGIAINLGKGHGKFTFKTILKSNVRSNSKFDFPMKNLNFSTFTVFLPPTMERVEGIYNGKVHGIVNIQPAGLLYNVKVDVSATDGKIKGLKMGKIAGDLLGGMKDKLKGKVKIPENQDIPDGFKKFIFKGQLTEKLIAIEEFLFYGVGDKLFIQTRGKKNSISMLNQNSKIEANLKYTHGKAMSELKKTTGLKAYPILLKGKGFGLTPDIGYTISKLTSGAAKAAISKAKEKAKKKGKKKLKKSLDKLKKNLFKKFKF